VVPEFVRDGQVFVLEFFQLLSIWSQFTLALVWHFGELSQRYFEKTWPSSTSGVPLPAWPARGRLGQEFLLTVDYRRRAKST
jgi:hypothetical protein